MVNPTTGVLFIGNMLSATGAPRAPSEELADRLERLGYPVSKASSAPNRVVRLYDMLAVAWKRRDHYAVALVDVFSGASFFWAEAVCALLRRIGKPYVLTLHGGNLPSFAGRYPRRVANLLKSAAVVTAPSAYLRDELAACREDIIILPNAIDCASYSFRHRQTPQSRLLWLRAYHEIYQPQLAPMVVKELSDEFSDCRLVMIGKDKGDGSLAEAEATAVRLGVQSRCEFRPEVPKHLVPEALTSGDIFLNTTTVDNTPVSIVEAAACGLCIVSTNVGGIPRLLTHRHDALLVPPNDAPAMACAVREILTDRKLAATLSENAYRTALQFDWPSVLDQWQGLISSCARHAVLC